MMIDENRATESLEKILMKNEQIAVYSYKKELVFKFLIIGDFGVGKTSIIKRYADGTFDSSYKITIGADFAVKFVQYDENTKIHLHLWDIAGHERFGTLTGVYYRYAAAAAIVFDLTRPETFKSVEKWLLDLRAKIRLPGGKNIPIIILANKADITLSTISKEIDKFCDKYDIKSWFITSAKENINVNEAMETLMGAALKNHNDLQLWTADDEVVHLAQNADKENSGRRCCQT